MQLLLVYCQQQSITVNDDGWDKGTEVIMERSRSAMLVDGRSHFRRKNVVSPSKLAPGGTLDDLGTDGAKQKRKHTAPLTPSQRLDHAKNGLLFLEERDASGVNGSSGTITGPKLFMNSVNASFGKQALEYCKKVNGSGLGRVSMIGMKHRETNPSTEVSSKPYGSLNKTDSCRISQM